MPIDYKLYVKETPSQRARKWRKISEYKEMLEIPSVRMIHPYVSPVELYKKCSLAITVIGSAGLEAAFYEKPSIVFSDVNYAVLPSVSRIKSFDELSNAIHDSLNKKVVASDLEKYITLVKKNSFPADIFGLRTSQHDHFFYGGYLVDVDITIPKMKGFLEENKSTFEKLADENFEKIKEYKKITNSFTICTLPDPQFAKYFTKKILYKLQSKVQIKLHNPKKYILCVEYKISFLKSKATI